MDPLLLALKFVAALVVVIGLSLLAERASPRLAGILSGIPTGSAIALFFFGVEQGADYAAASAVYNMLGLAAMCAFLLGYLLASRQTAGLLVPSLVAVAAYGAAAWLLTLLPGSKLLAVGLPVVVILLFMRYCSRLPDVAVGQRVPFSLRVLLMRALLTGAIVLAVTLTPRFVGSSWAGLFSAFPSTLFPLILILHRAYGRDPVATIIKNAPVGLLSVVVYSLVVAQTYSACGVGYGTILAYAVVSLYLALYAWLRSRRRHGLVSTPAESTV